MDCHYRTREKNDEWLAGEIVGYCPVGHNVTAVVRPKDGFKLVSVELAFLEVGDEHPVKRSERLEAKAKAEEEAKAKPAPPTPKPVAPPAQHAVHPMPPTRSAL